MGSQLSLFNEKDLTQLQRLQLKVLQRISDHPSPYVAGIDEVGMGAWAGPVTVAVVVLRKGWSLESVRDSKKFTGKSAEKAREKVLHEHILPSSVFHMVLSMDHLQVDRHGLSAVRNALTESVGVAARMRFPDLLIVQDGLESTAVKIDGSLQDVECLPKADALVPAVGAASILAKVTRDRFMKETATQFPGYDFAQNKGYHNVKHKLFLKKNGPCPIHRMTYEPVKKILEAVTGLG